MHFAWFVESATQVTLLGRRDGTTCPKWVVPWLQVATVCGTDFVVQHGLQLRWQTQDMLAFLRPLDENLQTNKAGGVSRVTVQCNGYTANSFRGWKYDQL